MSQHGWVALLEDFAAANRLPVEMGTPVVDLAPAKSMAGAYCVSIPQETILARSVVIASVNGAGNWGRRAGAKLEQSHWL